jgi:hypothetical protein
MMMKFFMKSADEQIILMNQLLEEMVELRHQVDELHGAFAQIIRKDPESRGRRSKPRESIQS